ncbi:hypothetical protein [Actinoplanes palleronii]|nr:hypothetical protein [Actinoplanes palleronii]
MTETAQRLRRTAAAGDPTYRAMLTAGVDTSLDTAVRELADFPA